MSIASTIAVSGLNVASLRLQVSASNVANSLSDGYAPLQVDQVENANGGTSATVRAAKNDTVSLEDEAVQQLVASYTFAANALVIKTDARMTKSLIDTIA